MAQLLNSYLKRFQLAPVFDAGEVVHMLLPQTGVVESWVVETAGVSEISTSRGGSIVHVLLPPELCPPGL